MKTCTIISALAVLAGLALPSVARANDVAGPNGNEVDAFALSGKTIYPYVHDGYKDSFKAYIELVGNGDGCSGSYSVQIVRQSSGQIVRSLQSGTFTPDNNPDRTASWDGKNNAGTLVTKATYYTMRVVANFNDCQAWDGTTYSEQVVSNVTDILPRTGDLVKRHTASKMGRYRTNNSSCANYGCVINPDGYGLWMQSFDYGINATWNVSIPSGAYNLSCSLTVDYQDGPHGKSCKRTKPGVEQVTVSVPTWSVTLVQGVQIAYTIKRAV